MKRETASTMLFLLLSLSVMAGTPVFKPAKASSEAPELLWGRTYRDATTYTMPRTLVQTDDGGLAVAGMLGFLDLNLTLEQHKIGQEIAWLWKTNETGHTSWTQNYGRLDIPCMYWLSVNAMIQTSDGGYALAGSNKSDYWIHSAFLVKYDERGRFKWARSYCALDWTTNRRDVETSARALIQTSDGGYALAGDAYLYVGEPWEWGSYSWLAKTDSAGNLTWDRTSYGYGSAWFVAQTKDGGYALASGDCLIKTYSNGIVNWTRTYSDLLMGGGFLNSAQQTRDGGYIMVGTESGFYCLLVKMDADGNVKWQKNYGRNVCALSVIQTRDGGYAAAGCCYPSGGHFADSYLFRTDEAGNELWNLTFGTEDLWEHDWISKVVQTNDGGFAMCGLVQEEAEYWYLEVPYTRLIKVGSDDTDGDGLLDYWEEHGIDVNGDGNIDLNLPALGAKKNHKDLFVEVDYMEHHRPDQNAINDVINNFTNALVDNPDRNQGINLHVLIDEQIPHQDNIQMWTDFDSIKGNHFGTAMERTNSNWPQIREAKRKVFRYCLFIHTWNPVPRSSGRAEISGNDFVVSLGWSDPDPRKCWGKDALGHCVGTLDQQEGTFMHELGHTLGLLHGGGDNINGKPNYLSIMSYSRQFSDLIPDRQLDYSRQKLPSLDETNLNENVGIQGPAGYRTVFAIRDPTTGDGLVFRCQANNPTIDWNKNGIAELNVGKSINYFVEFGDNDQTVLEGYNDWANVRYSFRGSADFADGVHSNVADQEITWEMVQEMRNTAVIPAGLICAVRADKSVYGKGETVIIYYSVSEACDYGGMTLRMPDGSRAMYDFFYGIPTGVHNMTITAGHTIGRGEILFQAGKIGGLSGIANCEFSVQEGTPPDVRITRTEINGLNMTVNGEASAGTPGTTITRIHWDWGDTYEEDHWFPVSHTYASHGSRTITVTAYQSDGLSSTKKVSVFLQLLPEPPVASFYTQNVPWINETIGFNASPSEDPDGMIVKYTWDFGDGNIITSTQPVISHIYRKTGNYTVTLNVTDNQDLWNTITSKIKVTFRTDLDRNFAVNILDMTIVAIAFGSKPGDPNWNTAVDMDKNSVINIVDLTKVAIEYGKTA